MKNIAVLFLTILGMWFCMKANSLVAVTSSCEQELKLLFYKNYLNADDNIALSMYVSKALAKANSPLHPTEVINRFKEIVKSPEIEKQYLALFASEFSDEELKEISQLLDNELYMK